MKIVVRVQLLPDAVQASALAATLHACNQAANEVSRMAFERRGSPVRHCSDWRMRA